MTVRERVAALLHSDAPARYCDGCIQKRLGLKRHQQAQQETAFLAATPKFAQAQSTCSSCHMDRKVTWKA